MVTINIGDRYPRRKRYRRSYRSRRKSYGRSNFRGWKGSGSQTPDTGVYIPSGGGLAWNPINFPNLWHPVGQLPSGIHQMSAALFE
tara:strand:- start:59 stop:316 length:258 start_codon:yes stop_codon:yes gene_type:complete